MAGRSATAWPRAAALALLLPLPVAACATSPAVDFGAAPALGAVPPADRSQHGAAAEWSQHWHRVRDRWTRTAHITHDWDTALDARVALVSPEYRAAYVRFLSGMRGYSDTRRDELASDQRADGERFVEVWVSMQTSRWEWNDLSSARSVWNLTFQDGSGRTVEPLERAPISLKGAELAELFPDVTPFTMAWRVRFPIAFPDGTPLMPPAGGRARIRFAGPLGDDTVEWRAR